MMLEANWCAKQPTNPQPGDCFFDITTGSSYIWTGLRWALFSSNDSPKTLTPTQQELTDHPTLKEAWEQYVIIRKLLGL